MHKAFPGQHLAKAARKSADQHGPTAISLPEPYDGSDVAYEPKRKQRTPETEESPPVASTSTAASASSTSAWWEEPERTEPYVAPVLRKKLLDKRSDWTPRPLFGINNPMFDPTLERNRARSARKPAVAAPPVPVPIPTPEPAQPVAPPVLLQISVPEPVHAAAPAVVPQIAIPETDGAITQKREDPVGIASTTPSSPPESAPGQRTEIPEQPDNRDIVSDQAGQHIQQMQVLPDRSDIWIREELAVAIPAIVMNLSVAHLENRNDARHVISLFRKAGTQRGAPGMFRDAAVSYTLRAARPIAKDVFDSMWTPTPKTSHTESARASSSASPKNPKSVAQKDALEVLWRHVRFDIGVERYKSLRAAMYVDVPDSVLVRSKETGLGRLLARFLRGSAFCTPHVKRPRIYLYDEASRLWKNVSLGYLTARVDLMLRQIDCIKDLPAEHAYCLTNRGAWSSIAQTAVDWLVDDKLEALLDFQPHLISVSNGLVIDLATGVARERTRADMYTREMPVLYRPGIDMTKFNQVVSDICVGDRELIVFKQRKYGYGLIGGNPEKKLFYSYGGPNSGKSTLTLGYQAMLGLFGHELDESVVVKSGNVSGGAASPHLAELAGVLAGIYSEGEERVQYNEGRLKKFMTDKVKARPLFGSPIEFQSLITVFIQSNHEPSFTDPAFWCKVVIDPFPAVFAEAEGKTKDDDVSVLQWINTPEASSMFLNWALEGVRQYFAAKAAGNKNPLAIPRKSLQAVEEYQLNADPVKLFFTERIVLDAESEMTSKELHDEYSEWARAREYQLYAAKTFGTRFTRASGIRGAHSRSGTVYKGIALAQLDVWPEALGNY
jgi:P4 family phage/plasmid primase-like protien